MAAKNREKDVDRGPTVHDYTLKKEQIEWFHNQHLTVPCANNSLS